MTIRAKIQHHPGSHDHTERGRSAAYPVTFADTVGLFMPSHPATPACNIAVLLVSPWGYEEMCVRKLWRVLAEDLADAGIASLRFDHAGTGDALDIDDATATLDIWRHGVVEAAETLRRLSGVTELILIGQGVGAALAVESSVSIGHVEGIAALAPMLSGRSYLRELSVWARMTEGKMADEGDVFTVGGLTIPDGIVKGLRVVNLTKLDHVPAAHCLVANRPDRPAEADFAQHLATLGARVETLPYEGYDQLVGNLTFSRPPAALIEGVVNWVKWVEATRPRTAPATTAAIPPATPLRGPAFAETPVRFGDQGRLFGILCEPADGIRKGATTIMLTTAYERLSGWGRVATRTARELAAAGVPSLRFDAANAADSPPVPGAPRQIIYSDAQYDDVEAALGFIEQRHLLPAIVAGRCSGGYLAFRMAARDRRFSGAVAVNPYVFYWDGSQSIEELLLFVPQQLTSYGVKLFRRDTWKRIANGEINLKYGVINTFRSLQKRSLKLAGPLLEAIPSLSRESREVQSAFQAIESHGTELSLMYSEGDVGLDHFSLHFGADGAKLDRYANVRFALIPDADHSLTTAHSRDVYRREVEAMALRYPPEI